MSNFYDTIQMAAAAQAMRGKNLDSVILPHAAVNGRTMPIHLATFAEQIPVQFRFRDIDLQRDEITLQILQPTGAGCNPGRPPPPIEGLHHH